MLATSLTLIACLFGLAGSVGGVVGFLSYGRAKTIIELQSAEIKAREDRYNTINEQYAEVKAQASAAEAKAKVLEGLVTQTPSIERLTNLQSEQHAEVIKGLSEVAKQLSHLVEAMSVTQREQKNAK